MQYLALILTRIWRAYTEVLMLPPSGRIRLGCSSFGATQASGAAEIYAVTFSAMFTNNLTARSF